MKETAEIIEMAKKMTDENNTAVAEALSRLFVSLAERLYDADYRKQSEGEWVKDNASQFKHRYNCSVCDFRQVGKPTPYCPNCGAMMKGGE
jgi:rubrerythrin